MKRVRLDNMTIERAAAALRSGTLSSRDLIDAVLDQIALVEPALNAFVNVFADAARAAATVADTEIADGRYRGSLHGIPMAVKDLIDIFGSATTASSRVRADYFPVLDASVISRLLSAGAITIGKSHTHEFAYGGITPQSHNPWDVTRITGGSSGGSAAAVAAGEALFGLGTDTAGSIRIPASCCGVVGIKPTFGRVSRHGVTPLATSLDHVGPLTRTVRDAALVLGTMAGHDPLDPTSLDQPVPDFLVAMEDGVRGLRVGVPENYFFDHCSDAVVSGVRGLVAGLEAAGARLVPFRVRDVEIFSDVEFCIVMAEASAFHHEMLAQRSSLYLDDTREKLEAGQEISAVQYLRALAQRRRIADSWRDDFTRIDVLVTPTLPTIAPRRDQDVMSWSDGFHEPVDSMLTRLNLPHNLTGQPALTLRCGFDRGMPFGIQFIGRESDEATVFMAGRTAEKLLGSWSDGPYPFL